MALIFNIVDKHEHLDVGVSDTTRRSCCIYYLSSVYCIFSILPLCTVYDLLCIRFFTVFYVLLRPCALCTVFYCTACALCIVYTMYILRYE